MLMSISRYDVLMMVMPMMEDQTTIAVLQCVMIVEHAAVRMFLRADESRQRIGTDRNNAQT
jgi:hypothetical protein